MTKLVYASSNNASTFDSPSLTLDWESGKYSDWKCILGNTTFHLHRNVLANTSRGSRFFAAAFNGEYQASSTDVTQLLPGPCHKHFVAALGFMYGHDLALDTDNLPEMFKIADVLQIDSLLHMTRMSLQECNDQSAHLLRRAMQCQSSSEILEYFAHQAPPSKLLSLLDEMPLFPGRNQLMALCIDVVEKREEKLQRLLHDFGGGGCLNFGARGVRKFGMLERSLVNSCHIRVIHLTGSGPTIGVSQASADVTFEGCRDGGFAIKPKAWGICLTSGSIWSQGVKLGHASQYECGLATGKVLIMQLDCQAGVLRFVWQGGDELCRISDSFAEHAPLAFTVSASCAGTIYEVLGQ